MKATTEFGDREVGYDIPALPGMDEADIQTPWLPGPRHSGQFSAAAAVARVSDRATPVNTRAIGLEAPAKR